MNIHEKLKNWIKETVKVERDFTLLHPRDIKNGDYAFYHSPFTASDFGKALNENKISEVDKVEVAGGFVNFYLSKEFFTKSVEEILKEDGKYGQTNLLDDQKILIEHTQPNPFKEFHIGHLMNNAIGESVARIIKTNGAETKIASYHGDVGLHVAKTIWGKMQKPDLSWGEAYAYGSQNFDENKEAITEINKKVFEKSDKKINELYKEGKKFSLDFFESIYKRLDSHFDYHFYESQAGEIGKKIVLENIGKVFEKSDGAIIFRGEDFAPKTHTRVFINSEGLPTYEAKEVGLAEIKKEKYAYDKSVTITANEQDAFFDVVEVAIGKVFPELRDKLKHLSHGMLRLPTGKMSSRTGEVISAEALINQVKEKVLEKMNSDKFENDLPSHEASDGQEKQEIAEMVAIGAIKYSILRQAIGGDIIFDFDKSISFEGDSGPYLQYACVRANSVLEKAPKGVFWGGGISRTPFGASKRPENFEITELEKYLYRFPEVVERAGAEYAPHYIVTYLTELASVFNAFYANNKILDENDPTSHYKIALTRATSYILKSGLHLLSIKVPERM